MGGGGGGREGDMVSREWTDDLTEVVGGSAGEIRRRPQFIHSRLNVSGAARLHHKHRLSSPSISNRC